MSKYIEIIKSINETDFKRESLRRSLELKINETIDKIVYENSDIEVLSENPRCFIIKSSSLLGNPFNPEFYDLKSAKKVIMDYLKNKDPLIWVDELVDKINNSKGNQIDFVQKIYSNGAVYKYQIPVNKEFVKIIVSEINKN